MAHFLCHLGAHILELFCSISILPKTNEICFIPLIGTDKGKEVMKNLFKKQLKRQKK